MLLLLAWAQTRQHESSPDSLHEALDLLDRAAAVQGLQPSPALAQDRATYLEALGEVEQAKAARAEATRTPPASARDHYLLALGHARGQRFAAALAELRQAIAANPEHYWSWCLRGLCHQNLGEHALAVADFSFCLGQAPEGWIHLNRGYSLYVLGQRSEAIDDYTAALKLDPTLALARWNRGVAELELGQYTEALEDFRAGRDAMKDQALRSLNEGIALEGLGKAREADAAFAGIFPALPTAEADVRHLVLCRYGVAVTTRLPDAAARAFARVLREDPEDPYALYGEGALDVLRGEAERGLRRFDEALDLRPDFVEARRFRAIVLARKGRGETALKDINFCLGKEPNGMTLYAAACVTALVGRGNEEMAQQAIAFLHKAFAAGYGRDKAAEDDDLTSLRLRKDFRELIGGR